MLDYTQPLTQEESDFAAAHHTTCPQCGALMWNGRCENLDCTYHWRPKDDDSDDDGEN